MLLTIEGVWLATKGYADTIHHEGLPPLREVLDSLLANGGQGRPAALARSLAASPWST